MKNKSVASVGFGLGGHHEDYITEHGGCYLSGYDSPDNWTPDEGVDYSRAVVIDKRDAVSKRPSLAYRSPLLRVGAKGIEKFDMNSVSSGFVEAIADQNPTVAVCLRLNEATPSEEPGPFDNVDIATYAAWWKSNGARIGTVNSAGRIIWEDGELQPRRLTYQEMAAHLGLEVEKYYEWGDQLRIKRDGVVIHEKVSPYTIQDFLAALGAPRLDPDA